MDFLICWGLHLKDFFLFFWDVLWLRRNLDSTKVNCQEMEDIDSLYDENDHAQEDDANE